MKCLLWPTTTSFFNPSMITPPPLQAFPWICTCTLFICSWCTKFQSLTNPNHHASIPTSHILWVTNPSFPSNDHEGLIEYLS
jgi:hypothetical protein